MQSFNCVSAQNYNIVETLVGQQFRHCMNLKRKDGELSAIKPDGEFFKVVLFEWGSRDLEEYFHVFGNNQVSKKLFMYLVIFILILLFLFFFYRYWKGWNVSFVLIFNVYFPSYWSLQVCKSVCGFLFLV